MYMYTDITYIYIYICITLVLIACLFWDLASRDRPLGKKGGPRTGGHHLPSPRLTSRRRRSRAGSSRRTRRTHPPAAAAPTGC